MVLKDVQRPDNDEWGTGLQGLEAALGLEKKVNQALLNLHGVSTEKNDPHFADFLESEYLVEQVEAIKELGDLVTKCKRAGPGLGEYLFDKELKH